MFDMADVPERVFVGVCEQNWRDRESCRTGHMPLKLREHVQYMSVNSSMAKGPTYGRALAQKMFNDEDYYMQVCCFIGGFTRECSIGARPCFENAYNMPVEPPACTHSWYAACRLTATPSLRPGGIAA